MTWQLVLAAGLPVALALAIAVAVLTSLRRKAAAAPGRPIIGRGVLRQLLLAAPIRLWGLILAGPPLTAFAAWIVYLVRYGWAPDRAQQQLEILGVALYGALVLIGVIVVSLAAVKLDAETRLGKLSIGHDDDQLPPSGGPVT